MLGYYVNSAEIEGIFLLSIQITQRESQIGFLALMVVTKSDFPLSDVSFPLEDLRGYVLRVYRGLCCKLHTSSKQKTCHKHPLASLP